MVWSQVTQRLPHHWAHLSNKKPACPASKLSWLPRPELDWCLNIALIAWGAREFAGWTRWLLAAQVCPEMGWPLCYLTPHHT